MALKGTEVSGFVCKDVAMQKKLHILVNGD